MKSESQDSVRATFGLSPSEKIYDDFSCNLTQSFVYVGRIFITENNLCFNSTFKPKVVIPFSLIRQIKKESTSNIEIIMKKSTKLDKYSFNSFKNRNLTYKRIKMIARAYLKEHPVTPQNDPNAGESEEGIILSDSENSQSEDDEEKKQEPNKENEVPNVDNKAKEKAPNKVEANNAKSKEVPMDNKADAKPIVFSPLPNDNCFEGTKYVVNLSSDEFFTKFYSDEEGNNETNREAFMSFNDNFNVKIEKWKELENENKNNGSNEVESNNENANNPPKSESSVPKINKDNINTKFTRVENFFIHLTGVPFVNQSEVKATMSLERELNENNEVKYLIKSSSVSVGVPFCTCYTVEDCYEIYPYQNNTKCVIRSYLYINWIQSTMFKKTIAGETEKQFYEKLSKLVEFIKKCGIGVTEYSAKKQKKEIFGLMHGIQKEHYKEFSFNTLIQYAYDLFDKLVRNYYNTKGIFIGICIFFVLHLIFSNLRYKRKIARLLEENRDALLIIKNQLGMLIQQNQNKEINKIQGNKTNEDL